MAKFMFLSEEMDSMALQCRLISEGHDVKTCVKLPDHREIGTGILSIVPSWQYYINWADYWVADSNCFGTECEILRKLKKKVFGGNKTSDRTEDDRAYGLSILESYGIDCGNWAGPFSADEAIKFITENPARWVVKPNGSLDKDLTYVSSNAEDALEFLNEHKSEYKGKLIVQEFIEDAKELAIGATFSKGKMLLPVRENVEHKNLNEGNRGPATGEMGTIVHYTNYSPLLDALEAMAPWFEEQEYTGDFDLNFMVQEDGTPICLETTARPGYPISIFQCDNIDMEYGDYLINLIEGELSEIPVKGIWSCGVVVTAPGMPFKEAYHEHGLDRHVDKIESIYEPGFYIYCMSCDDKGYKTAGNYGAIFCAVENRDTLDECIEEVYEHLSDRELPKWLSWRTDIGASLQKEDLQWFQERGYLCDTFVPNNHSIAEEPHNEPHEAPISSSDDPDTSGVRPVQQEKLLSIGSQGGASLA
jgi:phosphoribosylamine--glycine ligase